MLAVSADSGKITLTFKVELFMSINWLWGYFIPIGLLLLTWGGLPPHKARRVTPLVMLSIALATLGYWAVGFALHLGGAHAVNPNDPALRGLDMLFAPAGADWGLAGITGFFMTGVEITPSVYGLFLSYLPLVIAAVTLVTLAISDLRHWAIVLAGAVMGLGVFPIAACWAWGSGWLAHLGQSMMLGHGFVDFSGGGLVLWLSGMMVLGILLLQPKRDVDAPLPPPPPYFPLLANLGALLLLVGWAGWSLSSPFHLYGVTWDANRATVSALLGISGAVLTAQLYAWLVTGELESLLAARGIAAGWSAVLAGAPFMSPWAALSVGLLAGLAFAFVSHFVAARLRLRDEAATIALGLVGGLGGLLSVGLFADGHAGQGLNGIGRILTEGELGIGITGLIAHGNWQQLQAQLVGLLALGVWGLLWGLLLGFIANPQLPWIKKGTPTPYHPAVPVSPSNDNNELNVDIDSLANDETELE